MLQNARRSQTTFVSFRLTLRGRHMADAQKMNQLMAGRGVLPKLTDREML